MLDRPPGRICVGRDSGKKLNKTLVVGCDVVKERVKNALFNPAEKSSLPSFSREGGISPVEECRSFRRIREIYAFNNTTCVRISVADHADVGACEVSKKKDWRRKRLGAEDQPTDFTSLLSVLDGLSKSTSLGTHTPATRTPSETDLHENNPRR